MISTIGDFSKILSNHSAKEWSASDGAAKMSGDMKSPMDFTSAKGISGLTDGGGNLINIYGENSGNQGLPSPKIEGNKSFGEFLSESLSKVNDLQKEANVAIEKLTTGESENLHETMLMVEQAEIAFKMMNQIRQKVMDAYKEVMRIQI